ncbi:unnamed protein product [Discula destructiva]
MADQLTAAPVLSTSDDHLFEYQTPDTTSLAQTDEQLHEIYEVERTARECREGGYTRIALQFPDHMLGDAPRLVALLQQELHQTSEETLPTQQKIWVLADTSYSACCVDEIAAEHVDADVVIHFGRSCLSPTSRLPVIYVFTKHQLDLEGAAQEFETEFPDKDAKVVLMADVAYQDHVPELYRRISERGYKEVLSTSIQHNPLGRIPNRAIMDAQDQEIKFGVDENDGLDLKDYSVFHVSSPPTALLLALSSRIASLHVFQTSDSASYYSPTRTTRALLGRRYAKLLSLTSAGVIGILVNTLSVANYLSSIDAIRKQIAAAGKKSYTIVVGKLNPAKLANFSEIEAWVVIGCWESSLVEEDANFYRPVLTPFELEVALMPDEERVWGLSWWGGIESVKAAEEIPRKDESANADSGIELDPEDSEVPIFDLRTGKLVSTSRPMRKFARPVEEDDTTSSSEVADKQFDSLTLRPKAELATVNGVFSPGADYLRSQRTWQGLGTDFDGEEAATIEEGRGGVARGYKVGDVDEKR